METYYGIVIVMLVVALFVVNHIWYSELQKLNEKWYNELVSLLDKVGEDNNNERNNVSR